jgi:lambda family phage portal protein
MNNEIGLVDHNGNMFAASDTAYDAASYTSKEMADWDVSNASADADLLGEMGTIVGRSNDLIRNNGIASGYSQTSVDNIVGAELRLACKPDFKKLGKNKEWADEWSSTTESSFREWANSVECDASRQMTFGSMTQLVLRTGISSGESIAIPMWLKGRRYRTAIMLVDPSRMSNPDNAMDTPTLKGGIHFGRYADPIKYSIRNGHEHDVGYFDSGASWETIPARNKRGRRRFIHTFDKKRVGQTRGEPAFASIMGEFKMAASYQKTELRTTIANSLIAAFIESNMSVEDISETFDADYNDYLNGRKGWKASLSGGDVIQLPPGDKVTPFTPSRPGSAFADFMDASYKNIATGLNIPDNLLRKDFTKTSYSAARAAMLEAWRFFIGRRAWLSTYWAQPVYELWLEEAVMRGEIDAPDFYQNRAAYSKAKWIGPGRGWVDVVKEAKGAQMRMDSSLSTQQDECAEQGKDYEEVQDQRAGELTRAFKVAKENGLPPAAAYRIAGFSNEADSVSNDEHFIPDDDNTEDDGKPKKPTPNQEAA